MTHFEHINLAATIHSDASRLTVALLHIANGIERGEFVGVQYGNACKAYAEIGRKLADLAPVVYQLSEAAE